ncbi:MAG TPA: TIR domain-containing protein [Opitutaceae bacterium]|nr:TIR domain-containing protein [Opitutaceae bacterium]
MSDSGKAVFLSYASQDAVAAQRIAEALRTAGLEVWFDQSELRGGDAWDQKIRRQIRECALFVPIISANTNARPEGYFRLEWKLAVDRSHLLADDHPFLFPVAIDGVTEATARVPDKFREVQWTQLRLDETPGELAARVARLLRGGGAPAAAAGEPREGGRRRRRERQPAWVRAGWSLLALFAVACYLYKHSPLATPAPAAAKPAAVSESKASSPEPLSPARQLVERARAMSLDKYDSTADDYAAAEGLLKRALALEQNDPAIWVFSSLFNTSIRTRGFDHASDRREQARRDAERALKLAPDSIDGLFALGRAVRDFDPPAAEKVFKQILARDPNHVETLGNLASIYDYTGRPDESAALYERVAVANPAHEALTRYTEYLLFFHYRRFEEAERCIRRSVALQPSANSQGGLAMLQLTWKGDAEEAARTLANGVTAVRNEPRVIWTTALVQLCRRAPDEALRALDRLTDDYIQDNWYAGPKAYFAGRAHALAGRPEAARVAWEGALALTDARLKSTPDVRELHLMRGQLLAFLGRSEEALREARALQEMGVTGDHYWFGSTALIYAALGRADEAMPLIEKLSAPAPGENEGWPLTPALLALDPIWDKLRGDPRFAKLVAAAPQSEARQLAARAHTLFEALDSTRDDYKLAEELLAQAKAKAESDAEVWAADAQLNERYNLRGWDTSDARREAARLAAQRALRLDPLSFEVRYAQSELLAYTDREGVEKERLLRGLRLERPTDHRILRQLGSTIERQRRVDDGIAFMDEAAALYGGDPLALYNKSQALWFDGRSIEAERAMQAAIAQKPFTGALLMDIWYRLVLHGDIAGAKATLDRLPASELVEDRGCYFSYYLHVLAREPDAALACLAAVPRDWLNDNWYRGPKGLLAGAALQLAGRPQAAAAEWRATLKLVEARLATAPTDIFLLNNRAVLLAKLGELEEATRQFDLMVEMRGIKTDPGAVVPPWVRELNILLGRKQEAIRQIGVGLRVTGRHTIEYSAATLRLDPLFDPLRGEPGFPELLAEAQSVEAAAAKVPASAAEKP